MDPVGCIVILIGLVAGVVGGFFTGWLANGYGFANTVTGMSIFGALGGAIFGGILGTITGDLNRASTSSGAGGGGGKFVLAALAGAFAGALGGSKFQIINELMTQFRIPSPF
jgi:hypothetical protein